MNTTLHPAHLKALGAMLPGEKNRLSPFSFSLPESAAASTEGESPAAPALKEAGLLTHSGDIEPPARRTLQVLARPRLSTSLRFTGTPELFEYFLFAAEDGGAPVSLTRHGGDFRIEDPARPGTVLAFLGDCLGKSALSSGDFEVTLTASESFALAAALDLQRRAAWDGLARARSAKVPVLTREVIQAELDAPDRGASQWFTGILRHLSDEVVEGAAEALGTLADRGLLDREGETYRLGGEALVLASRLLLIQGILKMQTAWPDDDEGVRYSEALAVQGGVFDLLRLEAAEDQVRWRSLSPLEFLAEIEEMLEATVAAGNKNAPQESESAVGAGSGGKGEPESKPSPSSEIPAFCSECGAPVRPGDRFCRECGHAF